MLFNVITEKESELLHATCGKNIEDALKIAKQYFPVENIKVINLIEADPNNEIQIRTVSEAFYASHTICKDCIYLKNEKCGSKTKPFTMDIDDYMERHPGAYVQGHSE